MKEERKSSIAILNIALVLSALLAALKLTGLIDWRWHWVTLPLWGLFAIKLAIRVFWIFPSLMWSMSRANSEERKRLVAMKREMDNLENVAKAKMHNAVDNRDKIAVKFPWQLAYGPESWAFIIETTEVFFRYHGILAFVFPADVTDFITEPQIKPELKSDLLRHIPKRVRIRNQIVSLANLQTICQR